MTILLQRGNVSGAPSANLPNDQFDLGAILAAIDNARALDVEKLAAKSLIGQLNANPLAWSAVKTLVGARG